MVFQNYILIVKKKLIFQKLEQEKILWKITKVKRSKIRVGIGLDSSLNAWGKKIRTYEVITL